MAWFDDAGETRLSAAAQPPDFVVVSDFFV
jgi:hypothetical protein